MVPNNLVELSYGTSPPPQSAFHSQLGSLLLVEGNKTCAVRYVFFCINVRLYTRIAVRLTTSIRASVTTTGSATEHLSMYHDALLGVYHDIGLFIFA